MVKNEQDIIEPFIRHNARFLDCMVIIDNASVDDTRQIVVNCARETGKVIVSDSSTFAYTQAEQMTKPLSDRILRGFYSTARRRRIHLRTRRD